jgi:hypothetical protein
MNLFADKLLPRPISRLPQLGKPARVLLPKPGENFGASESRVHSFA